MRTIAHRTLLLGLLLALAAPTHARGGRGPGRGTDSLSRGDPCFAPVLETLDEKKTVDLSATGGRPLVLVFSSYT